MTDVITSDTTAYRIEDGDATVLRSAYEQRIGTRVSVEQLARSLAGVPEREQESESEHTPLLEWLRNLFRKGGN